MAKKVSRYSKLRMTLPIPEDDYAELIREGERLSLAIEGCKISLNCASGACKLVVSCEEKETPPIMQQPDTEVFSSAEET